MHPVPADTAVREVDNDAVMREKRHEGLLACTFDDTDAISVPRKDEKANTICRMRHAQIETANSSLTDNGVL
jgi:hypothetical protein